MRVKKLEMSRGEHKAVVTSDGVKLVGPFGEICFEANGANTRIILRDKDGKVLETLEREGDPIDVCVEYAKTELMRRGEGGVV